MTENPKLSVNQYIFWTINLILATFFWGSTFVLVKEALANIDPISFLALRFVGTAILVSFTLRFLYNDISIKELFFNKYGWILGFLLNLSFLFQTIGLSLTSPGNAAFVTSLYVPFVPLFLILFFKRSVNRIIYLWTAIAILGLILLTLNLDTLALNLGDIVILITAVSLALHIIYTSEFSTKASEGSLIMAQFLSMAVFSSFLLLTQEAYNFVTEEQFNNPLNELTPIVILALLITIVFATIYAFYVQTAAQKRDIPAEYIALIFAFEPVFALIFSILAKVEPLTLQKGLGALVMFVAILGTVFTQTMEKTKETKIY